MDTTNNYYPVEASPTIRLMWAFVLIVGIGVITYWPLYYSGVLGAPFALDMPRGTAYSLNVLELLFMLTSLSSFHHWRRNNPQWRSVAIAALVFAVSSGLVGIATLIAGDVKSWVFWAVSIALTVCPIIFLRRLSREWRKQATIGH